MRIRAVLILAATSFLLSRCATPTSPTGGPPDKTGPTVERTFPKSGTVNFQKQFIEFDFSEFITRSTFQQAFNMAPALGLAYKVSFGRKSAKVSFDKPLPDSTTMVFTLGTALTDYHGNTMAAPVTLALSTGPTIDSGKLHGKIISAVTGKGVGGKTVFLFLPPFHLHERARYTLETDTSGTVSFTYLKAGKYRAFLVDDRNSDKIWEPQLEGARPFNQEFFTLSRDSTGDLGTIYVMPVDTVRPDILGVGLLSSRRLRLRFSKPIPSADSLQVTLTDSLGRKLATVDPLYRDPEKDFVLYAESPQDLLPNKTYKLQIRGLKNDTSVYRPDLAFQGSDQKDTTSVRIVRVINGNSLYPSEPLKVLYSVPIKGQALRDSVKVIQDQTLISPWPKITVTNNELIIHPDPVWQNHSAYGFRLYNPATFNYLKVAPKIWYSDQMGELEVTISGVDTTGETLYHIHLVNSENRVSRDTTATGSPVTIHNLPPLDYTVSVYQDRNRNGIWDPGTVDPYHPPEPLYIQPKVTVRSRLTGQMTIDFGKESGG